MSNKKASSSKLKLIIIGIQLFDILVHVAVDRIEPLRILGNVVILVWIMLLLMSKGNIRRWVSHAAISLYTLFNVWFIITSHVFAYFTGQELIVMFALITSTLMFSLTSLSKEKPTQNFR